MRRSAQLGPAFDAIYARSGRPSIAPFVGLSIDDPVWDATVFTKNRERLLEGEVAEAFFTAVVDQARAHGLLSDEHFTVDRTLIEAWAGHKSFKRKDNPDRRTPPDE
jgi:transposase